MRSKFYQTDIGYIPVGWEPYKVGDLVSFSGGSQPDKTVFKFRPEKGYIRLIQIRDYKTDKYETYIPENLGRKFCDENDVMIGRYGPPIFQILRGIEGAYNVALIKASPSAKINKSFFYHFIKNENLFSLMDALSRRSSGQTGVELPALKEYPLPLPGMDEQTAIANALSDVDALITSLKKLIAKKRAIKTAAMQQLLTGKKRLPPFGEGAHLSGKTKDDKQPNTSPSTKGTAPGYKQTELGEIPVSWEVRKIGSFTDCTAGGTPSTSVAAYWGGDNPWMSSGELHLKRVFDVEERITDIGIKNSSTKYIPRSCVLMGLAGQGKTRGTVAVNEIELCTNQSIAAIFPSDKYVTDFLYYNLETRYEELRGMSTGDGGRGGLNLTIIKKVPVAMPSLAEQKCIVSVLKDMDSTIEALEQRLKKSKQLKQGMMQELLTGRTRLV